MESSSIPNSPQPDATPQETAVNQEQANQTEVARPGVPGATSDVDTASQVDAADANAQEVPEEVPLNAQVAAQQEQERQLAEDVTADELDEASNQLRANPTIGNQKIAGKLNQAAEELRDKSNNEEDNNPA
jgi:hypothetical protein